MRKIIEEPDKYAINDGEGSGEADSFDSDQQREIALLD